MAKRGRPKGGDSAETRERIIHAARYEFATCGFDGASVATIAAKSDLAPSAVYHYFGGKAALYEEVFDMTAAAVWGAVDLAASSHDSLVDNVRAMVDSTLIMSRELMGYSDFLALVPMETMLHPEFGHMMERRSKWQDNTFGALAQLGVETGELAGFSVELATDMLRSLIMGWFLETYFGPASRVRTGDAVITVIEQLAER